MSDKLKAAQLLGKWCGLEAEASASSLGIELIKLGLLDSKRTNRVFAASKQFEEDIWQALMP